MTAVIFRYIAAAIIVIAEGVWLPMAAKQIALLMHWHESFVGTLLVAFVTTVPEMVVAITAVRIQALDLAIGSIFGSNLFNIAILAIEDICYKSGPILSQVEPIHSISELTALIMTGLAIIGLFYRSEQRILNMVSWISWFLLVLYLPNSYFLFTFGSVLNDGIGIAMTSLADNSVQQIKQRHLLISWAKVEQKVRTLVDHHF